MSEELSTITLASSDRVMRRFVEDDPESPYYDSDQWTLSNPVPGVRIVNTWQIYHNIWLTLSLGENGHYYIFRTIGEGVPALVHEHETEIYNIFYVDDGHAILCATDGWWGSVDSGVTWVDCAELRWVIVPEYDVEVPEYDVEVPEYDVEVPEYDVEVVEVLEFNVAVAAAAIVQIRDLVWNIVAYAQNQKIYCAEYPGSDFEEVCDVSAADSKWYPAIAGGPAGILAGAGSRLLRANGAGRNWELVQTVSGIIKSIVVSNQSRLPTFLITVESLTEESDRLFWTYDLGDSLIPELSRVGSIASVQSVVPTGTNEQQTSFIVLGKRTAEAQQSYKIIEGDA
jgi:hypothetical protein